MSFWKAAMTTMAAASLVAVPTIASAQASAAKLSVSNATRASAEDGEEKLAGGSVIIAVLAAAAIIAGIIIAADGDDDPVSA